MVPASPPIGKQAGRSISKTYGKIKYWSGIGHFSHLTLFRTPFFPIPDLQNRPNAKKEEVQDLENRLLKSLKDLIEG